MKKRTWRIAILAAVGLSAAFLISKPLLAPAEPAFDWMPNRLHVVIDAGHGGEDGGAVSESGAKESDLNLEISFRLRDLLAFLGVDTMMLREKDCSLHNQEAKTIREKKVSDLHNRVDFVEESGCDVLISIHQNSYPQAICLGSQVFYAETKGSAELAEALQQKLGAIQPENHRESRAIGENVYLLNHISCPAVLVECGFLSSPQEAKLLGEDTYQKKLAASLACGLTNVQQWKWGSMT